MFPGRRAWTVPGAAVTTPFGVFGSAACALLLLGAVSPARTFGQAPFHFQANRNTALVEPPDCSCAAGPSSLIGVVNVNMGIYDKQGGTIFQVEFDDFFDELRTGSVDWDEVFDPKILFDQYLQKFIVVILAIQEDDQGFKTGSRVLIAVSTTPNPTGDSSAGGLSEWSKYQIDTSTGTHWSDYPALGVDEDTIYISYNMFPKMAGTPFTRQHLISKAGLDNPVNPPPVLANVFFDNITASDGSSAFTVQPAHSFGTTQTEWFASILSSFGSNNKVYLYARDGGDSPNNFLRFQVTVPQFSPAGPARQSQTSTVLDAVSDRLMNVVWRDSSLWTAHSIQGTSGAAVRWYEFDTNNFPATPTLVQSGDVTAGPGGIGQSVDNFMPAIMTNPAGDMLVTYTCTGPNNFPSMCYAHREFDDALGTTRTPTLVVQGQNAFTGFGFGFERWGDYAGNALDPSDQATFWMFHETAAIGTPSDWTTWFGMATLNPPGGGGGGGGPPPLPAPSGLFIDRPNQFVNFVTGTTERISWSYTGDGSAPVKLLLFRNNIQVGEIASNLRADQADYDWTVGQLTSGVTIPPGDTYLIRVASVNNPAVFDNSATFFRITEMVEVVAGVFDAFGLLQSTAEFGPGQAVQLNSAASKGMTPYFFKWTPQDFLDNPNISNPVARPLRDTTYTVTVRDSTGNMASTTVGLVQGNPLTVDAGASQLFPIGGSIVLEGFVTGGNPPYTVEWFDCNPDSCVALPIATSIQPVVTPPGLTVYYLRVTDSAAAIRTDNVLAEPGFASSFQNDPGNGGIITRSPVKALYRFTEPVAFTATPNSGFIFDHWEGDVTGSSNPITISFPDRNIIVRAVYRTTGASQPATPFTLCGMGLGGGFMVSGLVLMLVRVRRRRFR